MSVGSFFLSVLGKGLVLFFSVFGGFRRFLAVFGVFWFVVASF